MKLFAAALAAALAGCATAPPAPAAPTFYVMRHLQKAGGPDPALSAEGQANAARLAEWFGAEHPGAIFVSRTRRARETAAPLAARLGLSPREYDPSDTPGLVAQVLAQSGTVLVVGHSNTVPEIVERLGGERPADLAETDFGTIWRISGPERKTEARRLY